MPEPHSTTQEDSPHAQDSSKAKLSPWSNKRRAKAGFLKGAFARNNVLTAALTCFAIALFATLLAKPGVLPESPPLWLRMAVPVILFFVCTYTIPWLSERFFGMGRSHSRNFVAFAGAIIFPVLLLFFARWLDPIDPAATATKWRYSEWVTTLILLFGGFTAILATSIFLYHNENDDWHDLWEEIRFFMLDVHFTAYLFAGGLGSLLAGIYLIQPAADDLPDRYRDASLFFFTSLFATLGLHAFYRRNAPVRSTSVILRHLVHDLTEFVHDLRLRSDFDDISRVPARLCVVFPSLNLGYYTCALEALGRQKRPIKISSLADNTAFHQFELKLLEAVRETAPDGAIAMTYPCRMYQGLHNAYAHSRTKNDLATHPAVTQADLQELGKGAAYSAEAMLNGFRERGGTVYETTPAEFPPQFIVIIGDVTYTIVTFGLPAWSGIGDETRFEVIETDGSGAHLTAYRRKDSALAASLFAHVQKLGIAIEARHSFPADLGSRAVEGGGVPVIGGSDVKCTPPPSDGERSDWID
ncbi:MAG: hypothetical protein JSS49_13720 [Planctomycetes bacterium]|nr:hypothetical protein [Planctomycetota bacterium]